MIGVISLVGIINTLALSVFERTREIGMLRAVGTTRRQLRRMVRYESVITSVIGGLIGVGVGLVFGWILTKGLSDQGIQFSVPVSFIIVVLVVAALAGSAGGDPAGPAGGAAGRPGGAAVRVEGWFHGCVDALAQDGARWTTGCCKPWLAAVGSDLRFTQIADGAGRAG